MHEYLSSIFSTLMYVNEEINVSIIRKKTDNPNIDKTM